MAQVVDAARHAGAEPLWLGVWERNPRAIAFYRKFGYADVGAHVFVVGTDPQTDRIMTRPLAGMGVGRKPAGPWRIRMRSTLQGTTILLVLLLLAAPAAAQAAKPDEATLLAADAEQKRIIVEQDLDAQRRFMHENYIINPPANRVLRKTDALAIMARGGNAAERFDRVIEGYQITGNIGIVMGREVEQPTPDSQLGGQFGARVLSRPFTNVLLFENGRWVFLARHATVLPDSLR
ncbi:MAG: GNAT family N-acetyltransferase [Gemmatimonadaceae bacterium]